MKTTIYSYKKYSIEKGETLLAPHKATKEAIEQFEAELIEGSAEEIEIDKLDADGRYTKTKFNMQ